MSQCQTDKPDIINKRDWQYKRVQTIDTSIAYKKKQLLLFKSS